MNALNKRLDGILMRQHRDGRLRSLEPLASAQGPSVTIEGRRLLNFCSNDYLGLSGHPALRAAAGDAMRHYGVGSGASALLSGRSALHAELENRLAAFLRRDRALLFSSGYLANLGVIAALVNRHDHVFHDRLNHASLIDAVALTRAKNTRYPHADTAALERQVLRADATMRWIVTDTVFSMDGDLAPLAQLSAVARRHDAVLIGDDAHGFGVLANGRGAGAASDLDQSELPIQIVTFGKALGTAGAAVVGSARLIETLIQRSRTFIYDTAPPPLLAAATIAALELVASDQSMHDALASNIARFRRGAAALPLSSSTTPIQPVLIGDDRAATAVAAHLRELGIYVRAIRPPTVPVGTARLRICVSAAHSSADIDTLIDALTTALKRQAA